MWIQVRVRVLYSTATSAPKEANGTSNTVQMRSNALAKVQLCRFTTSRTFSRVRPPRNRLDCSLWEMEILLGFSYGKR